jgi:iron-sulfur cluster assembly protein
MIQITDIAKARMISILEDGNSSILRFGLKGGGCSGLSYFFAIEHAQDPDDFALALDSTHVLVIDVHSNLYLETAIVDFRTDFMGERFAFTNTLQSSTCGCGSSVNFE